MFLPTLELGLPPSCSANVFESKKIRPVQLVHHRRHQPYFL